MECRISFGNQVARDLKIQYPRIRQRLWQIVLKHFCGSYMNHTKNLLMSDLYQKATIIRF